MIAYIRVRSFEEKFELKKSCFEIVRAAADLGADELEAEGRWVAVAVQVLRDGLNEVSASVDIDRSESIFESFVCFE